ncbi:Protein phosphatase 2C (PP2C)-like domain-containing protein [Aphelenchoides bicaudatus]|nr:Protein phosphatase 2C (PP2C)-like domain-containing protein [Aphelenchoides bicaudatus]
MSFFRKHVRGLLRQTFSSKTSSEEDSEEYIEQYDQNGRAIDYGDASLIYERILNGKNGRKVDVPEVYAGKTGLDLPIIHLDKFSHIIRAAVSGPDGGLTNVQQMRKQPIIKMANLDDELSLSMGSEDEFDSYADQRKNGQSTRRNPLVNGSLESLGFCNEDLAQCSKTIDQLDWQDSDSERAYGLSISLYEKHPITGLHAGMPVADVFAVLSRQNNSIICLADGVNWGESSRLAARCAIRGAVDHLNDAIENNLLRTTTEIFHCLLGAFHTAHALILQEGGSLTTLCVGLIAPVKNSNSFVLCVCNVGDSLCFVQNSTYGVREVTLASHEIEHRNMRDAGGALGPVDGRNPQLHNLTCSMSFVEEGDFVFLTSDGISDNFDPVVGKFCMIRKNDSEKENSDESPTIPIKPLHKTKSMPNGGPKQKKRCVAVLPCVDAAERQELMLLRMADVISNGIGNLAESYAGYDENDLPLPLEGSFAKSPHDKQSPTASSLCHNLINFAYNLSNAKRRTLEDPELYRTRTHSKTEERLRRKMIRNMLMEMPGKLDHASVVAFKVGQWDTKERTPRPLTSNNSSDTLKQNGNHSPARPTDIPPPVPTSMPPPLMQTKNPIAELNCLVRITKPTQNINVHATVVQPVQTEAGTINLNMNIPLELQPGDPSPRICRRSPYEEQPVHDEAETASPNQSPFKKPVLRAKNNGDERQKRKHKRGSTARHTLGVDVTWLKKLVINRHFTPSSQTGNQKTLTHVSGSTDAVDDIVSPTDMTPSESQNLRSPSANCSPTHRLNPPKPLHHSASTGVPLLPPNQHPNRLHTTASSNSSANFSIRRLKQMISRPSQAARFDSSKDTQL